MIRAALRPLHAPSLAVRGAGLPGRLAAWQALALILPVAAAASTRGAGVLTVLGAAIVASLACEATFAVLRGKILQWNGLPTAMILAVMIQLDTNMWQIALATIFGVALADQVFGGRGFGFLGAATAALAFLIFSFPDVSLQGGDMLLAAATVPGAALLVLSGLASWRVLVAAAVVAIGVLLWQGGEAPLATAAALVFALVFLTADPIGAAVTNPGRWLYGALVGLLVARFGHGPEAVVFATLIGSVFAPLIDHLVVSTSSWRRRRRHG